jgi:hypothetical protein
MTKLINKSSYDIDVWLQRGVKTSRGAAGFLDIPESVLKSQDELQKLLVDTVKRVTDPGFLSCGSAKGTGFDGYIFNIYCPKGTKMMYAEPFTRFGPGAKLDWDGKTGQSDFGTEVETIIQRGTTFRITKVEKKGGNIYFDIEVIWQILEGD